MVIALSITAQKCFESLFSRNYTYKSNHISSLSPAFKFKGNSKQKEEQDPADRMWISVYVTAAGKMLMFSLDENTGKVVSLLRLCGTLNSFSLLKKRFVHMEPEMISHYVSFRYHSVNEAA